MKRLIYLIAALLYPLILQAQPKEVSLIVTGEGATKEEATNNALRSAIEQAFGVFVSSNTELLNDELVRDEIATISSGNVKSYREISTVESSSGTRYVTLDAVVSIGKLIEYSKTHGSKAEFAGAIFGANLKLREHRKKEEPIILEHYLKQMFLVMDYYNARIEIRDPFLSSVETIPIAPNIIDRCLGKSDFFALSDYTCPSLIAKDVGVVQEEMYLLPLSISYKITKNGLSLFNGLKEVLKELSLKEDEIKEYEAERVPYYRIILSGSFDFHEYCLRDYKSIVVLADLSRLLSERLIKDWKISLKFTDNKNEYYRLRAPSWIPFWVDSISSNDIFRDHGFAPVLVFEENGLSAIKEYTLRKRLGYLPNAEIDLVPGDNDELFVLNLVIDNLFKRVDHQRILNYFKESPNNKRIPWEINQRDQFRLVEVSGERIPDENWRSIKKHHLSLALEPSNNLDPIILFSGITNSYPVEFSFKGYKSADGDYLRCDYESYKYNICIPLSQEKLSKITEVSINSINDHN